MSITIIHQKDGIERIDNRRLSNDTGSAPGLRLLKDIGFNPGDSECDLYQHPDGFAILVKRSLFEVSEFKCDKITIKRKT